MNESAQFLLPKVTVVIVNWNGQDFLDKCLSALMQQTVLPHEILVLDNASSDNSTDIVRRYPLVRLILAEENTGFARGNNLAIASASSESNWIALLNPDAFPEPSWLSALLAAAASYPEFDVFGSKLLNAAQLSMLDGTGDSYHISGQVWRTGHGMEVSPAFDVIREIFSPCAAAALYRRCAMHAVGGFDEDYFCYVEDVDLGFRMRLAGYRCLYVPQSVVHHVGSGTTGGAGSDFATYYGHRNLVWTFVKNMPGSLFWLLLPLHVLLNLVTIIFFSFRGRGGLILKAKRDAVAGIPAMLHKRKTIQLNRVASITNIWGVLDKNLAVIKPRRKKI